MAPSIEDREESRERAVFKVSTMETQGLLFHRLKCTLKSKLVARLEEVLAGRFLRFAG